MDVKLPDGTVIKNVPDNMSKAEFVNMAIANGYARSLAPKEDISDPSSPTVGGRLLEGIGQGMNQLMLGAKQRLGMASEQDVLERRKIDAPLLNTTGGMIGSIIGQALPTLPLGMIPGGQGIAGSTLIGAGSGALQPTAGNEDVMVNAATGGAFGAGGHALGKLLFNPVRRTASEPTKRLLQVAKEADIDLPVSVQTGSKPFGYFESNLAITPGGGKMADALQKTNEQFTKAVMKEAGAPGELATQANLRKAKAVTQKAYDDFWLTRKVKVDSQFIDDLIKAKSSIDEIALEPKHAAYVEKQINNLLNKIEPGDVIDGAIYQRHLRGQLRRMSDVDTAVRDPMRMVQKALDNTAKRNLPAAEARELDKLNYTYAVQKHLENVMQEAEARGGTFTPTAVRRAAGELRGGGGKMEDLAKIGVMLKEPPQSGTAPRMFLDKMVREAPLIAAGAGAGYSQGGIEGAGLGALAGLAAPWVAANAMTPKLSQNFLSSGLLGSSIGPYAHLLTRLGSPALGLGMFNPYRE